MHSRLTCTIHLPFVLQSHSRPGGEDARDGAHDASRRGRAVPGSHIRAAARQPSLGGGVICGDRLHELEHRLREVSLGLLGRPFTVPSISKRKERVFTIIRNPMDPHVYHKYETQAKAGKCTRHTTILKHIEAQSHLPETGPQSHHSAHQRINIISPKPPLRR